LALASAVTAQFRVAGLRHSAFKTGFEG